MRKSDRYWLKKLKSRHDRDFHAFFDHFFPRLYRFAFARLGSASLAEEAVQEALSRGIMKIDTYLGEAALFSWLCTITRHEVGRILKRERDNGERTLTLDDEAVIGALDSLETMIFEGPETRYEQILLARRVKLTMSILPPHYADLLEWRYLQGESVSDIATKINKSYKAVESLLSRARALFRDAFLSLNPVNGESAIAGER